jgi:hypothetical protein
MPGLEGVTPANARGVVNQKPAGIYPTQGQTRQIYRKVEWQLNGPMLWCQKERRKANAPRRRRI